MAPRILLATLVAGCAIEDEADYVESRAVAECDRIQACSLGYFDSEYGDLEDCVDERSEDLEDSNDSLDDSNCKFVPEEASPCVSRIRSMSCEDWVESEASGACDLVWDCTDFEYYYYGYSENGYVGSTR